MKLVPLSNGRHAMVDDEDYELVIKHRWRYLHSKGREYATTRINVRGVKEPPPLVGNRPSGRPRIIGSKRVTVQMHRMILPHNMEHTDHADGNGLNNQKHNLRPCTRVQNAQNRKLQMHSSRFKGVHFNKKQGKFQSYIRINKKLVHLGTFESDIEAANAYDRSATIYFGEFAATNKSLGAL